MNALWQRDISESRIDGVISVDPLALARVLIATGPEKCPAGARSPLPTSSRSW